MMTRWVPAGIIAFCPPKIWVASQSRFSLNSIFEGAKNIPVAITHRQNPASALMAKIVPSRQSESVKRPGRAFFLALRRANITTASNPPEK